MRGVAHFAAVSLAVAPVQAQDIVSICLGEGSADTYLATQTFHADGSIRWISTAHPDVEDRTGWIIEWHSPATFRHYEAALRDTLRDVPETPVVTCEDGWRYVVAVTYDDGTVLRWITSCSAEPDALSAFMDGAAAPSNLPAANWIERRVPDMDPAQYDICGIAPL